MLRMLEAMMVPMVVFMLIVAPLWLILHYRAQRQQGSGVSSEDRQKLSELQSKSLVFEERIRSLETILDAEVPGWRERR